MLLFSLLVCTSAPAEDRVIRIPLPPPPEKVLNKVGGFFHRLFNGEKDSGARDRNNAPGTNPDASGRSTATDSLANSRPIDEAAARNAGTKSNSQTMATTKKTSSRADTDQRNSASDDVKSQASTTQKSSKSNKPHSSTEPDSETSASGNPASPEISSTSTAPSAPPVDKPVEFARPVPGKRGFVYPPGATDSAENIVDVAGFSPGQIVRDPRTKALFRVP